MINSYLYHLNDWHGADSIANIICPAWPMDSLATVRPKRILKWLCSRENDRKRGKKLRRMIDGIQRWWKRESVFGCMRSKYYEIADHDFQSFFLCIAFQRDEERNRDILWFIVCRVTQKRRLNKFVPHMQYLLQWLLCDVSTSMHTCMHFESSFYDYRCILYSCPQNSSLCWILGMRLMALQSNWMHFRKRERLYQSKQARKNWAKQTFWND